MNRHFLYFKVYPSNNNIFKNMSFKQHVKFEKMAGTRNVIENKLK